MALPPIVALVIKTVSVNRQVGQRHHALLQNVFVTHFTTQHETITAMERNARQY